jgi:hypothetical protein
MLLSEAINEGRLGRMLGIGALAAGAAFAGGHTAPSDAYSHVDNVNGVCSITMDQNGVEKRTGDCGDEHITTDAHRVAHMLNNCPKNFGHIKVTREKTGKNYKIIKFNDGTAVYMDSNNNTIIYNSNGSVKAEYIGDKSDSIVKTAQRYLKYSKHK